MTDDDQAPMTAAEWAELPPVLTPDQVARVLGWKRRSVIYAAEKGTLPGRKIGSMWRFSKDRIADHTSDPPRAGDAAPDR